MKHKLLSLFALAGAMFMSASVWAWDEPVAPSKPTTAGEFAVGHSFYVRNVGAGQYFTGGNSWSTQISLTKAGVDDTDNEAIILLIEEGTGKLKKGTDDPEVEVSGYKLKMNGSFKTNGASGEKTVSNKYFFRDGETSGFIDLGSQTKGYIWKITKVGDYYRIQTADEDPSFPDAATQYAGWVAEGGQTIEEGASTEVTFNLTSDAANIDWEFIPCDEYLDQMKVYEARKALYAKLLEATEMGVKEEEVNAAGAVYTNPDATIAQLQKQTNHLSALIAGLQYDFSGASEINPMDVTEYVLKNPTFDENIEGWTITVGGQNLQHQKRTDGTVDPKKNWVKITNFIEAWTPSTGGLGDGTISQTVYGLPKGKYVLECDAMATRQGGLNGLSAEDAVEGAYIFIQGEESEVLSPIKAPDTQPKHWSVLFISYGDDALTFGLKVKETTANWISADNFKLTYYGETTKSLAQLDLEEVINAANLIKDAQNYVYSYTPTREAFEKELTDAIELDEGELQDDAVYIAATEKLQTAYNNIQASLDVYETLRPYTRFSETGVSILATYEDTFGDNGWGDLENELKALEEDFDLAYEEGLWSDEEVTTHIASIVPMIRTWIKEHPEALQPNNDVTILLDNADFEDGLYKAGWDTADDEVQPDKDYGTLPGWTISSGNITQMNHVIETYHRKFDFNQTIKDMPAGVYDITVQGFVRHDGSATDQTIFYAGDLETQLMLRSAQWSTTPLYDNTTMGDPCGGSNGDATIQNSMDVDVLVPNGMSGFYFWEKVENTGGAEMDYPKWQEGDLYYTNHIKATLSKAGDFTIGMKSLGNTDWIIWDNFRIVYIGIDPSLIVEMAGEVFNALEEVYKNTDYLTLKAKADYAEIAKEDYSAIATLEEYNAYKATVDALIAYIQEGTKLGNTLHDLLSEYGEKVNVVMFDTSDFLSGHYSEYSTNLENGTSPDNDYLSNAPDVLAIEWTQCAVKSADTGLFNNLGEVITNPQYTTVGGAYTLDGWNMEKAEEVTIENYLANEGVAEVYNPSGEYKFYQTIKGLKEGYYRVTVDAFFRPAEMTVSMGREACVAIHSRAYLFAEGDEMFVTPIKNILVGNDALTGVGNESTWTWAEESVEYTPNDVAAAKQYFDYVINYDAEETDLSLEADNQSVYRNALNAHVGEDGVLTIGITNYGVTDFVTNDWCCFSNWTLSLLGAAPDAIKGVSTKGATAPTAIFTIDGRQASRLQRGMNIVRQADGSVKKVLVK